MLQSIQKHRSRLFVVLGATLFAAGAYSAPSVGVLARGAPSVEFTTALLPALRANLGAAMLEMVYGDVTRAARKARGAGLPEQITVFIDPGPMPVNRGANLQKWAKEAVAEWAGAVDGVSFEFVDSSGGATAVIRFEDRLVVDGKRTAGVIDWQRRVRTRGTVSELDLRAEIRISNRFSNGSLMSEGQIKKVVAHEMGHLLGLEDQDCSKSLMGPVGQGANGLVTDREKRAVAELQGRTEEIAAAALQVRAEARKPLIFVFAK